jgi:GNAT superfamily N-acetyltransferase
MSPEHVLAEAGAWVWVPPEARTVETDEYLLIAYPEHFSEPTVATRWHSDRGADELIDEVLEAAHGLGRESVNFFELSDATRPRDLEQRLCERGAVRTETLAVLALDLGRGVPDLAVPADVEVRRVLDVDDLRATDRIDVAAFGGTHADEESLTLSATRLHDESRYLALRDGAPVGTAGHVVAGETVRLWGGAVLPAARHTGVYRALLDARLRAGVDAGCRVALVKGRVETSAPVLLASGFQQYGEVRAYRLARP